MPHAKRWRKRYLGRTCYLKTNSNGRKDSEGYLAAFDEWERLKAFLDGLGPNPYTETGALIPVGTPAPDYRPRFLATNAVAASSPTAVLTSNREDNLPPWIQSVGIGPMLHPEQIVSTQNGNPHFGERRISALADYWLYEDLKLTRRGELSLQQYAEDKGKLQTFRDFLAVNCPTVAYVDQINAAILNMYRDKQWEFVDREENRTSKVTLRKRLTTVVR